MEGKRWREICGERMEVGRGDWRRVGRWDWRIRRVLPSLTLRSSGGLFSPPGPSGGRISSMLDSDFAGIWILLGLNQVSGRLRGFASVDVERLLVAVVVAFATDVDDDDAPEGFVGDLVVGCDDVGCCSGECVGGWLERR